MKAITQRIIFLALVMFIFIACEDKKKKDPSKTPDTEEPKIDVELAEVVEPQSLETVVLSDLGLPIEAQELNDSTYVYQGDILFKKEKLAEPLQMGEKPNQKAVARTKGLWPDNKLYYIIRSDVPETTKSKIVSAMKIWETNSHVEFVNGKGPDGAYVEFYAGSGCSSYIGKIGGRQLLSVSSGCSTGNVVHEIAHALGFWHEQSRADRDEFITINWENIRAGYEHNFRTYIQMRKDGQELTEELDFGSIMMYPSSSFSKNGLPTIVKKDGSRYTTQRRAPSEGDVEAMNKLYPEIKPEEPVEPTYENGKYYFIAGTNVLRYRDRWFYRTRYGWKYVGLIDGVWYYI